MAGDFWGIPLVDGAWACGIVLQLMPKGMPGARVGFLGGLLDWSGPELPSAAEISTSPVIEQGVMHILAIRSTGGKLLGTRVPAEPLLDYFEGNVCRGFTTIRPWTVADRQIAPSLGWWGYDVVQIKANARFAAES